MSQSSRSLEVLSKILKNGPQTSAEKSTQDSPEQLVEKFFTPPAPNTTKATAKKPGRPEKADHLKAKNFTLCMDPKYISFLDTMKVHDKKVQGRSRKIKFIIDQFLELHRRQKTQLEVLGQSLENVETLLSSFSGQVKKGKNLELSAREKSEISKAVNQVSILLKVLSFSRKDLHKLLPRRKWAILSFCLDWIQKQGR